MLRDMAPKEMNFRIRSVQEQVSLRVEIQVPLSRSFDSSVGRAVDCSGADIHRSLVRIRLEGFQTFFFLSVKNSFFLFFSRVV